MSFLVTNYPSPQRPHGAARNESGNPTRPRETVQLLSRSFVVPGGGRREGRCWCRPCGRNSRHRPALDPQPLAEPGRPWMTWVGGQPAVRDGFLRLTDAPGFGVPIDEGRLQTL